LSYDEEKEFMVIQITAYYLSCGSHMENWIFSFFLCRDLSNLIKSNTLVKRLHK
jgi:hypothetical protein